MTLPDTDPSLNSEAEGNEHYIIFPSDLIVDIIGDIEEMHTKFSVRDVVETFDNEKLLTWLEFRLNFLQEELDEARSALSTLRSAQETSTGDAAADTKIAIDAADDLVDSMIDLIVVATGTLDGIQCDSDEAWMRVHAANMAKEPGVNPNRPNPLGLPDLIKPAGWTAPSHADNIGLLERLVPGREQEQQ